MYTSVVFSMFTMLYNHHHYLIPEHFHSPTKRNPTLLVVTPNPSRPPYTQPLATTHLLSVSMDLPILDIS